MSELKSTSRKSEESVKEPEGVSPSYQDVYVQKANNDLYEDGTIDPVYQAKARLLNAAIQEIGMGKYQVSCTSCTRVTTAKIILAYSGTSSSSRDLVGLRTFYGCI